MQGNQGDRTQQELQGFSKKAQSQTIHDRESVEVAKYRKERARADGDGDSAADVLSRDAYRVSALHIVISTYSPLYSACNPSS